MRLIAVTILAALGVLVPAGVAAARPNALETALVRQINSVRAERGLRPLVTSRQLAASAAQHTRDMGANGYFDHDSPDASPFWKRIQRWYSSSGWSFWSVGENLFCSSDELSVSHAVSAWLASRAHRANVLSRTWREIGISAMQFDSAPGDFGGKPVTLVTADFGVRR